MYRYMEGILFRKIATFDKYFAPMCSVQKSTPASLAVGNFFDRLGSLLETDVASKINLFMASSAFL